VKKILVRKTIPSLHPHFILSGEKHLFTFLHLCLKYSVFMEKRRIAIQSTIQKLNNLLINDLKDIEKLLDENLEDKKAEK